MRTRLCSLLVAALSFAVWPVLPANASTQPSGEVTLVHGVRGLVADIYLDGTPVLKVFEPDRITDPLVLAAGPHRVEVRAAGAAADATPLLAATLNVVAGVRESAVVHLDGAGAPALTVFADSTIPVPAGTGRLLIRHTAAAPAVDLGIDGASVRRSIPNRSEAITDLPAGSHLVELAAAAKVVLAPRDVLVPEGTSTALYLVGSATAGNLAWLAEVLPATPVAPAAVRTGNSLVAPQGPAATLTFVLVALACCLIGAASTSILQRRRRAHPVTAGAVAGMAGIALGVFAWAELGRSGHTQRDRNAALAPSWPIPAPKMVSDPQPKDVAVQAPHPLVASRPARIDELDRQTLPVPELISIQPGDIVAKVVARGANAVTGDMDIPSDPALVAWYGPGPIPGGTGSAVLAGHIAYNGHRGAFAPLVNVDPGAVILVTFSDNSTRSFHVRERQQFAKSELPIDELFRVDGQSTLVLITCGGVFNAKTHTYTDNVVLIATPL